MGGIYLLTFSNGDTYIGRSVNIKKRVYTHDYQLRYNKHANTFIQSVYNKHGNFTYEILEEVIDELQGEREVYWINELSPTLNLTKGGDGGELLTEDEKKRRRVEVYTDEYRKKLSNTTGRNGKKISESRKKLYDDPEKKKWLIEHSGIYNSKGYLNQKKRGESPNAKKVINTETGEIFNCLKDVSEKYNMNYSSLIVRMNEYRNPNKTPFRYITPPIK